MRRNMYFSTGCQESFLETGENPHPSRAWVGHPLGRSRYDSLAGFDSHQRVAGVLTPGVAKFLTAKGWLVSYCKALP